MKGLIILCVGSIFLAFFLSSVFFWVAGLSVIRVLFPHSNWARRQMIRDYARLFRNRKPEYRFFAILRLVELAEGASFKLREIIRQIIESAHSREGDPIIASRMQLAISHLSS